MPTFLKDFSAFYGTYEKNADGDDLVAFLEKYDAKKYDNPSVTTDVLVFKHKKDFKEVERGLKLLMIKRSNHPSIGFWALPGGFVNIREDLEEAAKRELKEETNLEKISIEQIYTWGEYKRDPRTRIITTAYLSLVEDTNEVKAGDDAADAVWFDVLLDKVDSISIKIGKNIRIEDTYKLKLINKEKNLNLEANILVGYNKEKILKETKYKVINSKEIAFDHPRIIVQALLYIKEKAGWE